MSVYHQMGHDSENLVQIDELSGYEGAILSPVNYNVSEIQSQAAAFRKPQFTLIFDPQLYEPKSKRDVLREWPYFPKMLDTADLSDVNWWYGVNDQVIATIKGMGLDVVCSPADEPKTFTDEYYDAMVSVGNDLVVRADKIGVAAWQTVLLNFNDIGGKGRALAVASIISKTHAQGIYLVPVTDVEPRREIADTESLKGVMRLIQALEESGLNVTVGFCSSDVLLWKAAGATSCATGKFFNLRRFTKSRFEEPQEKGGGQLPYWFEESLLAFLREPDVLRAQKRNLFSDSSNRNPFCQHILAQFVSDPEKAWLALSWRQYLWWFADAERRIGNDHDLADRLLADVEAQWNKLGEKPKLLMEERLNNGEWVRPWRRAIAEYEVDD